MPIRPRCIALLALLSLTALCPAHSQQRRVTDLYTKSEVRIPMRDGKQLFTSVYAPKEGGPYPILIMRTPYSAAPYGEDKFFGIPSPGPKFVDEKFIFVVQDVRGRYMSEGEFADVRPQLATHSSKTDIDESTDTYDTIDWLVKNVPGNNGRAGLYGISYPGFYAAVGSINSHPALKASSPQAPVCDWFIGDDWHRNGAFALFDAFNFYQSFGQARPEPVTQYPPPLVRFGEKNAYDFFLEMGPLRNADEKMLKGRLKFWSEMMEHSNYDEWWRARRLDDKLVGVNSAMLTVGGWYDAEDMYGALQVHRSLQKLAPKQQTTLVMGPWSHGGWGGPGNRLGDQSFGSNTGTYFRDEIYLPWFVNHLKGDGKAPMPKAILFRTGANVWERFAAWPPKGMRAQSFYLGDNRTVTTKVPAGTDESGVDVYVSDPASPVPYTKTVTQGRGINYLTEDQTFASERQDVLTYTGDALSKAVTVAGPVKVDLWISTTGSDADFVVKVIDVAPGENGEKPKQLLIRGDIMRARFRKSFEKPEPLTPGKIERVQFTLNDLLHTFQPGHRMMIQVQSSWFPLIDRNPQKFVDIAKAVESDFQKATIKVYRSKAHPSRIEVGVWEPGR